MVDSSFQAPQERMKNPVTNLLEFLQALLLTRDENVPVSSTARQFVPTTSLCERDMIVIDMLNSAGHEDVSYCITDPNQPDNPIVFSSDGFCVFVGYERDEIEGKNCRFLQGKDTAKKDVDRIRTAIKERHEVSVNLLNYRKDGTPFNNEFFLSPLYDSSGNLVYFIGVQCPVQKLGPGQAPKNCG